MGVMGVNGMQSSGSRGGGGTTLLVAGGGTGGHIYPAIAIAGEYLSRDASRKAVFVGTEFARLIVSMQLVEKAHAMGPWLGLQLYVLAQHRSPPVSRIFSKDM